jgi:hypothetical protein
MVFLRCSSQGLTSDGKKFTCVQSQTHIQSSSVGKKWQKMTDYINYFTQKIMFKCNINTNNCLFLVYLEKLSISWNITASKLIPVTALSNAWVFGSLLAQIAGSNPNGGTVVGLF